MLISNDVKERHVLIGAMLYYHIEICSASYLVVSTILWPAARQSNPPHEAIRS